MFDQSFLECWSLNFDDIEIVEGFNLNSRIWVAFQLRFFRTHGRFPSREDDFCPEGLQYLGHQLDLAKTHRCSRVRNRVGMVCDTSRPP